MSGNCSHPVSPFIGNKFSEKKMFKIISLPKSSETWPLVLLTITQSEYKKLSEEIFVPRHTQSPVSVKILEVFSLKGNTEEVGLTLHRKCGGKRWF